MAARGGAGERFLTTVLMTDIVGSTAHAAELGDGAWRELVQLHHALVRRALRGHGGREIDTAGDGFFATFDAPAAAIACAIEIATAVSEIGLAVRAGIHVGEVEQIGRKVGGIAVPIAARIMAAAEPGEVLVSGTVRDLSAGAGLTFEARGRRELKGVPGQWELFAVVAQATTGAPVVAAGDASRRAAALRRAQARPIWQRRPRIVAAIAIVAASAIVAAGLLAWQPWQPRALAAIGSDSVGLIDGARRVIVASIAVGGLPGGLVVTDGALWVTNTGADTVTRINLASRVADRIVDVGRGPTGIAAAMGSIWVANSGSRTVTRIDPATGRAVGTVEVGNGPTAIAAGAGGLWVASTNDSTVVRIDRETGAAGEPIAVAGGPVALATDGASLWIASSDAAAVTHLDGETGATLATPITLSSRPVAIAVAAGWVWVASPDGTVTRIDPARHLVTATIDVGGSPAALTATETSLWVADRTGFVRELSLAPPHAVVRQIATTTSPEAVAIGTDGIWVTARAATGSHRGGILRVIVHPKALSADPAAFIGNAGPMVGDGLVGYPRVGGTAGSTLMPALARALPKPTDGGQTYTFQLRPDVTYSNGERVRASDFRRGIERTFQVGSPDTGGAQGQFVFTSILGAERCVREDIQAVDRCDLAEGIVTDDAAGSITFHLTQPDPAFLYVIASQLAFPAPEGVPMNAAAEMGVPGTGPYRVESWSVTELRLTRNPNFREWDPRVRPDGFPDEIVFIAEADPVRAAEMVERGEADFLSIREDHRLPPEVFARLSATVPGQLRYARGSLTAATFNLDHPPFDRQDVRQAVNFAIDRGSVVDLRGGPLAATVACQPLPAGSAGYVPYCPYTTRPDPGGRWQAPDLDAARRLVAASGTLGAKVVVGPVPPHLPDVRDHLVSVLRDLGYDASADPETDYGRVVEALEANRIQVGVWEFFGIGPAAGDWMRSFTCGFTDGINNFCDADYDALIAEGSRIQVTDPAAAARVWAEADRRITDLALWAPLFTEGTDFVAARVGNYQFHPAHWALFDQMWVQ